MKLEHPIQTLFAPISVLIIAYRFFCSKFFIFCVNILAFPLFKRYLAKHGMLRLCGTNEKEIQMHSCIWKALGLWAWLPIILRMKRRLIISARSQIDYIFFSTKLCLPFTEHTFFFASIAINIIFKKTWNGYANCSETLFIPMKIFVIYFLNSSINKL